MGVESYIFSYRTAEAFSVSMATPHCVLSSLVRVPASLLCSSCTVHVRTQRHLWAPPLSVCERGVCERGVCVCELHIKLKSWCLFLCLTYLTQHNTLQVHPYCHKRQEVILVYGGTLFHCVYTRPFLLSLTHLLTPRLFPRLGYCKQHRSEHGGA